MGEWMDGEREREKERDEIKTANFIYPDSLTTYVNSLQYSHQKNISIPFLKNKKI